MKKGIYENFPNGKPLTKPPPAGVVKPQGCDASILLDNEGSERRAPASKTLRGFEVIDDIKAEVEKKCPKTVSCADILTAAAREATILVGGPYWTVPYGRRDGVDSIGSETGLVPMGLEGITDLIERYQSLGLNLVDLVVLSGSKLLNHSSLWSNLSLRVNNTFLFLYFYCYKVFWVTRVWTISYHSGES